MSLVPPPPGGAAYVYTLMADLINAAWDLGNTKDAALSAKITAATSSWLDAAAAPTMTAASVTAPTVTEPTVTIPASVSTSAVYSDFQTEYLALVQLLADKFDLFRNTYFPNESAVYAAAEQWLQDAINNPEVGLPATVAAQIWTDDRDRILDDTARATADLLATFAARRFPLPPGAAASAALQIQQKAQDEMAESSRKVAILSVEQMKFAIEKALSLRQLALNAAVDYIKALASGPDMASRLVNIGYDAQSKLISAVSQFYNARTEATKLTYTANQHNADLTQEASKANLQSELTLIEDKLKALLSEAQMLAQEATALFNNLHASSSAQGSDSVQTNL